MRGAFKSGVAGLRRALWTRMRVQRLLAVHRRIFTEDDTMLPPFNRADWQVVLLPGKMGDLTLDQFEALREAVASGANARLVVTDSETLPPHQFLVQIPWEFSAFQTARVHGALGAVTTQAFDASGSWGVSFDAQDHTWVGGDAGFVERFASPLGGSARLQGAFADYAYPEWNVSESRRTAILQSIGWEPRDGLSKRNDESLLR